MYPGLPNGQQNYPGTQPSYPGAQPSYPGAQPNYPGAQPSYPGAHSNYPGNQPGYTGPQPGYPQWGNPGFQQSSSDGYSGTVVNNGPGYPNNAGGGAGPGPGPSAPICKLIAFDFAGHKLYIEYRFSFERRGSKPKCNLQRSNVS